MKEEYDHNKDFVNLTYRCNSKCISCIMTQRALQEEKSFGQIKMEIDNILNHSDHIAFNGGEPTLNPDLFKILEYTNKKKRNVEISLLSNSRMFSNSRYLNRLNSLKLENFKILTSLYGHNARLHDSITRTPGSFDQQINAIKNLIDSKIRIELRIVINKLNYKCLDDIARFIIGNFKKEDFFSIVFVNMKIYGEAHKNRDIVTYKISEIMPYVEKSVKRLLKSRFNVHLFHFPHCVLPEPFWHLSKGVTAERTEICFLPECEHCLKREDCSGIWKGYASLFGAEEFNPIR